jgi:hypothetical protein
MTISSAMSLLAFVTVRWQARPEVTVQVARGRKASRDQRAEPPAEAGSAGREPAAVRGAR